LLRAPLRPGTLVTGCAPLVAQGSRILRKPLARRHQALLTAGLAAAAGLLAACGSAAAAGHAPRPPAASSSMTSRPMPGMAGDIPGKGLLATAAGLTLRPLTGPVPAGQASVYRFQIIQAGGSPLTRYQTEQTKLLHFYLVRNDLTGFEHLHSALAADGTWTVRVRPAKAGSYRVFTQFTGLPAGEPVSLVLSWPLTVTGPTAPQVPLPDPATTTQVAGYTLTVTGHSQVGRDSALTITVTRHGHPVTSLQPYLGTYAHLTAFHEGDLGFAHLHPSGPVHGSHGGPVLHFRAILPESGRYRLFVQFQAGGTLHTAQFTLPVS
jgi:hypothetical protein